MTRWFLWFFGGWVMSSVELTKIVKDEDGDHKTMFLRLELWHKPWDKVMKSNFNEAVSALKEAGYETATCSSW